MPEIKQHLISERGDATLVAVLVAGAIGAVIIGGILSGLRTGMNAQRHIALDEGFISVARHITESLSCANTLSNGYLGTTGVLGPVNLAAGNDCDPTKPDHRYLVMRDKNGNALTGALDLGAGTFQYTGASGEFQLLAECDRVNHTLVIRAARRGGLGGLGQDPLTKRTYDYSAANSHYLFGPPPPTTNAPQLCQTSLGGVAPPTCPAGQVQTGVDAQGNLICLAVGTAKYFPVWNAPGGPATITPLVDSTLSARTVSNAFTGGPGQAVAIDNVNPSVTNGSILFVSTSNPAYANVVTFKGNATANFSLEGAKPFSAVGNQNAASINFVNSNTQDWWHQTLRDSRNLEWHYRTGAASVSTFVQSTAGVGAPSAVIRFTPAGNISATGFLATSDKNLKTDIRDLVPDALERVAAIRGVTFRWKDGRDERRHMGVIAQEVERVAPELVSVGGDGNRSVDYGGMNGLLVEAIKDLKRRNDALERDVAELRRAVEKLTSDSSGR